MASVINNPTDSRIWKKAFDAKYYGKGKPFTRDEWDQLLGETQVVQSALLFMHHAFYFH